MELNYVYTVVKTTWEIGGEESEPTSTTYVFSSQTKAHQLVVYYREALGLGEIMCKFSLGENVRGEYKRDGRLFRTKIEIFRDKIDFQPYY